MAKPLQLQQPGVDPADAGDTPGIESGKIRLTLKGLQQASVEKAGIAYEAK